MTNMINSSSGSSGLVNKNVSLRLHITLKLDGKMVVPWPDFPFGYSWDTETVSLPKGQQVVTFLKSSFT